MATQRCEVIRRQKPPYQWRFTNDHRWRRVAGKVYGCCVHCGLFSDQVKCREDEVWPHADEIMRPEEWAAAAPGRMPAAMMLTVNVAGKDCWVVELGRV